MKRVYVAMTVAELQAACVKPGQIVLFKTKLSAVARMPKTPGDVRFKPNARTPVMLGMVIGVAGGQARIDGGHGECGAIAVEDALYLEDPL
jgi:hypothetical protein